jgi:hypothetical protein
MAFTHCQSSDPQRPQACQGLRQILQGHGLLDLGEGQPPQHGPVRWPKNTFFGRKNSGVTLGMLICHG